MKQDNNNSQIRRAVARDRMSISYRPHINRIVGRVTASILLQQMLFYDDLNDGAPFYKFRLPCNHELYREGDSWIETLTFTRTEFDTALSTIATKVTKGTSKDEAFAKRSLDACVVYWTDSNRVTWYQVNRPVVDALLALAYDDDTMRELLGKSGFLNYLENDAFLNYLETHASRITYIEDHRDQNTEKITEKIEDHPRRVDTDKKVASEQAQETNERVLVAARKVAQIVGWTFDALATKRREQVTQVASVVVSLEHDAALDVFSQFWQERNPAKLKNDSLPWPSQVAQYIEQASVFADELALRERENEHVEQELAERVAVKASTSESRRSADDILSRMCGDAIVSSDKNLRELLFFSRLTSDDDAFVLQLKDERERSIAASRYDAKLTSILKHVTNDENARLAYAVQR